MSTNEFHICGILDPKVELLQTDIMGFSILPSSKTLSAYRREGIENIAVGIGSKGSHLKRQDIYNEALKAGFSLPKILHQTAYISDSSEIHSGTQIFANCVINSNVKIFENSVLNSMSVVEHDSIIEQNVFTGSGVVICGEVIVEKNSFIGANSTIVPRSRIKAESFIKAHTRHVTSNRNN